MLPFRTTLRQLAEGLDPDHAPFPPVPDWLKTLLVAPFCQNGKRDRESAYIREGGRNNHLTSLAGSMHGKGMSDEAMFAALKIENQKRCDPPLPEAKVAAIAASVARYPAGPAIMADVGLVKRLADRMMLTEHFAQEPGGKLYRYSDGVYKPNGSAHLKRFVKTLLEDWNLTAEWSSARSDRRRTAESSVSLEKHSSVGSVCQPPNEPPQGWHEATVQGRRL